LSGHSLRTSLNSCKISVTALIEELKEMDIPEEDEKTLAERVAKAKMQAREKINYCFAWLFP